MDNEKEPRIENGEWLAKNLIIDRRTFGDASIVEVFEKVGGTPATESDLRKVAEFLMKIPIHLFVINGPKMRTTASLAGP